MNRVCFTLALVLAFPLLLSAQLQNNDLGLHPFGVYLGDTEHVSLDSGNLNLQLSIDHVSGRGGADRDLVISYNSNFWIYQGGSSSYGSYGAMNLGTSAVQNYIHAAGWSLFTSPSVQYGTYTQYGGSTSSIYCQGGYFLQQLDGGAFPFSNVLTGCYSKDPNSGVESPYPAANVPKATNSYGVTLDTDAKTALLVDGSIVKYSISPNTQQDRNGNIQTFPVTLVSAQSSSTREVYNFQDDTGTQSLVFSYGASPTAATQGNGNQQLAFPCDNYNTTSPTQSVSSAGRVLTSVMLQNGTEYLFEYDAYGDLTKVKYPSGGYTRYSYQTFCPLGLNNPLHGYNAYNAGNRYVTNKFVCSDANGSCSPSQEMETDYAWSWTGITQGSLAGTIIDTTAKVTEAVGTPDERITTTVLHLNDSQGRPVGSPSGSATTVTTSGKAGGSRVVDTSYQTDPTSSTGLLQKQISTTVDGVLLSTVISRYHSAPLFPTEVITLGSANQILRDVQYDYWPNTLNIQNQPVEERVLDASGAVLRRTHYGIDETTYPLLDESGAANHDPALGTGNTNRGNVTSTTISGPGMATVSTAVRYDILGNVVEQYDGKNNKTTISYADMFGSATACAPGSGQQSYIYPTTSTDPLGHSNSSTYYSCSGLVQSIADPNDVAAGRAGTTYVYDQTRNPTRIAYPNGGSQTTDYGAYAVPLTITQTTTGTPDPSVVTVSTYDGLQRLTAKSASGTSTEQTFDALGRLYSQTNPHGSQAASSDGITYRKYDALDRPISVTLPNSVPQTWTPIGNVVKFTNERGFVWNRTYDAVGQLTHVSEPARDSTASTSETDYTFDNLGNLLNVAQHGASGDTIRTRSFTYDAMSHLLCASNPETNMDPSTGQRNSCPVSAATSLPSGVTSYRYDLNGNVSGRTDARGVSTTYNYDSLNRLIKKEYTLPASGVDPTPSSCFLYDAVPSGSSVSNTVGRLVAEWTQAGPCPANATSVPTQAISSKTITNYNSSGNVLEMRVCALGSCSNPHDQKFTYNQLSNIATYTDGTGATVFTQSYDAAGRLQGLNSSRVDATHPGQLFKVTQFGPLGWTGASWGPSLKGTRNFDSRSRVTGESVTTGGAQ